MDDIAPANSIVAALRWDAAHGSLLYQDVRYLLIRPETLAELQRAVEARVGPAAAAELLFAGGFTGGQLSGRRYRQAFGLDAAGAVDFMCRMGAEIGWGVFELEALDLAAARLAVTVRASAFAQAYGPNPAAHPVCHLIRGVLGGLVSGLTEAPVTARETACAAAGAPACHFLIEAPA
jgi:predicted hydrocarbon binding protein